MAKGPFMEWLRNRVQESAVNTYTEEEIPTPASRTEKMAMLIHQVQFHTDDPQVTEGSYSSILTGLYSHSQSGAVGISDPDTIVAYQQFVAAGRYEGTLSEYWEHREDPSIIYFDPPLLYAKAVIYHGVQGVQQPGAAVKTSDVRIGYTLEKVSDADFIAALVE